MSGDVYILRSITRAVDVQDKPQMKHDLILGPQMYNVRIRRKILCKKSCEQSSYFNS